MFSLLAFFIHKTATLYLPAKFLYIGALALSLVGDILLMFDTEPNFFLAGVGSFLLTQVAYTYFFVSNSKGFNWRSVVITIPPILGAFYFLNAFLDVPLAMQLPLNLYGLTLSAMVLTAVNYGLALGKRALFINLGALIFLLSDLLLAYAKFGNANNKYVSILVMITYGIAQFLLATSVIAIAEKQNDDFYKGSAS